jgi:hypothetical protein
MVPRAVITRCRNAFAVITAGFVAAAGVAQAVGAASAWLITLAALAAAGAAIAVLLWWLDQQAERQEDDANWQTQIDERFARALMLLGERNLALGGIYLLEGIARQSQRHYEPVVEVLTAYIREHAPWPPHARDNDLVS